MRSIIFKQKRKRSLPSKSPRPIQKAMTRKTQWDEASILIQELFKGANYSVSESEFHEMEQRVRDKDIALNASQLLAVVIFERRYLNGHVYVTAKSTNQIMKATLSILGNPVGTGKTRIMMTLVALIKNSDAAKNSPGTYTNNIISTTINIQVRVIHSSCTIVHVGNEQLSSQWEHEAKLCGLRVCIISAKNRSQNILTLANEHDVLIVRGIGIKTLIQEYNHVHWALFIYDEPDHNVTPSFQEMIPARFHILVTASWREIHSAKRCGDKHYICRLGLHSKQFYNIGGTQSLVVCTAQEHPQPETREITFHTSHRGGLVSKTTDRLIATDNWDAITMIMAQMGSNVSANAQIAIESIQVTIDDAVQLATNAHSVKNAFPVSSPEYDDCMRQVCQSHKTVTKLNEQISTLKNQSMNDNCSICLDKVTTSTITSCNHIFCQKCIVFWIRNNHRTPICPNCRTPIKMNELTIIHDNKFELFNNRTQAIHYILTQEKNTTNNPKTIIYFNDTHDTSKIKHQLIENHVISTTSKNLKKYTHGDASVLLLSADYAGFDSLQKSTTSIIFYDPVSDLIRKQITGRIIRIGRPTNIPCSIYNLIKG